MDYFAATVGPLRDIEIRAGLRAKLRETHAAEPDTLIIDELSLCQGDARVDIAVVNGSLTGYEIKSERDTLSRLRRQGEVYALCFDSMIIVAASRHVNECRETLPEWWGVWEAIAEDVGVKFQSIREAKNNPQFSVDRLVQLLWKNEAIGALRGLGVTPPVKAGRKELWAALVAAASPDKLSRIVRDCIRARGDWRSGPTPFRGGGLCRSAATFQRSPANRRWLLLNGSHHRRG